MKGPMDTPERLWRTQFDKQLTDEMMERVIKATEALVRKVQRRCRWRDQQTADDRLHTAIVKTLDGTLKWDPERVDLERFFVGAIRGDITHEIEHSDKFRHVSLDDESGNPDALESETSDALTDDRVVKNEVPKPAWWSEVMQALRTQAAGEARVLAILDAYDHGCFTRSEVMDHTGLSSKKYHNAHQRLLALAQKVDDDVRELIFQAIA